MSASVLFDAPGPGPGVATPCSRSSAWSSSSACIALVVRKMQSRRPAGRRPCGSRSSPTARSGATTCSRAVGTLKAAGVSIVFAGVFGILLGLGRLSQIAPSPLGLRCRRGVLPRSPRAADDDLRLFGIYTRSDIFSAEVAPLAAVVTGLTLYNGSVIAELVRSGIFSLPKGQSEAGLCDRPDSVSDAAVDPAAPGPDRHAPALIGQFVVILKDSALGYQVLYQELLTWSKTLGSAFSNTVPAYIVAACCSSSSTTR